MKLSEPFFEEEYSLGVTVLSDTFLYKEIDATINKWLNLQKIIKESQSLENIINQQHIEKINQLKGYIHTYLNLKLKERKLYDDIKDIKLRTDWTILQAEKEYYLTEASGIYFGNAVMPIMNILSVIRDNYDYIPILVSLIDEEDTKQEVESLAEFLCNQFYTNILIPNPEQEELLICIYKLLEYEINKMDFANVDFFLDDSTFIGKLLTAFTKQKEINNFIVNLLSKVFNEIDKRYNLLIGLSLNDMKKYLQVKKDDVNRITYFLNMPNTPDSNKDENVLVKIPKTKINFKKQHVLEEEIFKEIEFLDKETVISQKKSLKDENSSFDDDENDENDENDEKEEVNMDYSNELTKNILSQKIQNTTNSQLKTLYSHLITELNVTYQNSNAFSNQTFFMTLNHRDFKQKKNQITKLYFKNFLFIQEQVDEIIQSLIDKIPTIPYSIRCICCMINILITRKFPFLPKYFRHSFIGKFLFNKYIFPVLSLENPNGLKKNLFSKNQLNCLKCIVSIISNANMCKLFDIYNDAEKTMFNYYLLDIIPILNIFYDKLVDMVLPKQLNEFINQSLNNINIRKESSFLFNENKSEKNPENEEKKENNKNCNNIKKEDYNYFSENTDEIIRLKSVCFNENDILFITHLINKNIEAFKHLPNFERVKKAMNERDIKNLAQIISEQKEKRKNKKLGNIVEKGYYTIFYEEDNKLLIEFKNMTKIETKGDKSLLWKIKDSIRTILGRLNLLNRKQYSYLNFAMSNEKFFSLINYTLKDFEDDNSDDNRVPLNWHSRFIVNNLNMLEKEYTIKDFEKIYEEMYAEEKEFLDKLRSFNPIINAREIMNINCVENAVENLNVQIKNLEKAKKQEKIKIFIINDKTEVCLNFTYNSKKLRGTIIKHDNLKDNNFEKYLSITTPDKCLHKEKEKMKFHIRGINDFIYKFKKSEGNFEILKLYIKEDIGKELKEEIEEPKHKVYKLFEDYYNILYNKLISDYIDFIKEENKGENKGETKSKELMDKIEDYIMQRIYQYVFPIEPLKGDTSFYELTKLYDAIPASYFKIKVDLPVEAIQESISYIKQLEEKAFSINEKMKCYKMILNNVNKINEFYCGKSGKSAEDQTPIYNYIILKSHPKRLISNINYINCFTYGRSGKDPTARLFTNNSFCSKNFIEEIKPETLNNSEEELNQKNSEESKKLIKV